MSSRRHNLEPYGRWHATIFCIVRPKSKFKPGGLFCRLYGNRFASHQYTTYLCSCIRALRFMFETRSPLTRMKSDLIRDCPSISLRASPTDRHPSLVMVVILHGLLALFHFDFLYQKNRNIFVAINLHTFFNCTFLSGLASCKQKTKAFAVRFFLIYHYFTCSVELLKTCQVSSVTIRHLGQVQGQRSSHDTLVCSRNACL